MFEMPLDNDPREAWMQALTKRGFTPQYHLAAPPTSATGRHSQPTPTAVIVWKRGWTYAVWIDAAVPRAPAEYPHWFLFRQAMADLGYTMPFWWWSWQPNQFED